MSNNHPLNENIDEMLVYLTSYEKFINNNKKNVYYI